MKTCAALKSKLSAVQYIVWLYLTLLLCYKGVSTLMYTQTCVALMIVADSQELSELNCVVPTSQRDYGFNGGDKLRMLL